MTSPSLCALRSVSLWPSEYALASALPRLLLRDSGSISYNSGLIPSLSLFQPRSLGEFTDGLRAFYCNGCSISGRDSSGLSLMCQIGPDLRIESGPGILVDFKSRKVTKIKPFPLFLESQG